MGQSTQRDKCKRYIDNGHYTVLFGEDCYLIVDARTDNEIYVSCDKWEERKKEFSKKQKVQIYVIRNNL